MIADASNGVTEPTPLERMRAAVKEARERNRELAEKIAEEKEMARLQEELAYEQAREQAYKSYGPDRVLGGEIEGAGFCVLHWPDEITWRHFNDRGILKKDGLKQELCDDLVARCLVFPEMKRFREMLEKNPSASTSLATAIIAVMQPEDANLGKGFKSSLPRR